MHYLSIILLSIAANLDNLSIGLAYGIRKIRIPFLSNLVISSVSGLFAMISCLAGQYLGGILPDHLGNTIGGVIIGCMGVWVIAGFFKEKKKQCVPVRLNAEPAGNANVEEFLDVLQHPEQADTDYSGDISCKESVVLGIALALNCLATGLGAGMTGLNVFWITITTILFSFLTIFFGLILGKKCASRFMGNKAALLAGALLIVIGLYEVFF